MRDNMWHCTIRVGNHLDLPAFLILSVAIQLGCENPETTLLIEKPTEVYSIDQMTSDPQSASFQAGKVITILKADEKIKAVGVYHGQDHDGFKVKLADGSEGLIIVGDTFRVVSR